MTIDFEAWRDFVVARGIDMGRNHLPMSSEVELEEALLVARPSISWILELEQMAVEVAGRPAVR
jgi:hypothetical protein